MRIALLGDTSHFVVTNRHQKYNLVQLIPICYGSTVYAWLPDS